MNTKTLSFMVVTALVCAGSGCNKSGKLNSSSTFTPPTGPVELKLKWTMGERVVQELDMKQTMNLNLPGRPEPTKQNTTMGQKYAPTVINQDATGGDELALEFLSARMNTEMGGKTMINY